MASLNETLTGLRLARMAHPASFRHDDRPAELDDFGTNPGALRGRIHVPRKLKRNSPLVVVLHGCTQSAAAYDHGSGWSKLADRDGFAVLFPEQTHANNPNLCFNWFSPIDVARTGGETESIRQMIDVVVERHAIDPARIFITGLSAGGAMTSTMLACFPEVFAAGAIIAGLPHGVARTVPDAFERMRGQKLPATDELQKSLHAASAHPGPWPRIAVWAGSGDQTVHPVNAEAIVAQWREVHGVSETPDLRETVDGARRRLWLAGDKPVIESWEITDLGHGTPINPGADGLGAPIPFMLDAGISSTSHIAAFFGLNAASAERSEAPAEVREPATIAAAAVALPATDVVIAAPEGETAQPLLPVETPAKPGAIPPKPATKAAPPAQKGIAGDINAVLDSALPGQNGLFGALKTYIGKTLHRAGLR